MRIVLACPHVLPASAYGGTERVVVSLAAALADMGHRVVVAAPVGSTPFDQRVELFVPHGEQTMDSLIRELSAKAEVVHLNMSCAEELACPYIITQHGNSPLGERLDVNTVFVSRNHAARYGSDSFVYNGLDWRAYGEPELDNRRGYFHFLGKAAWRVKNVRGAIDAARRAHQKLVVAGGTRLNVKMGLRFTPWPSVRFAGMVGGEAKNRILQGSRGLVFPVRWNEPFGLAVTESLYFGCPVFGTPYGSLPELVGEGYGVLSARGEELAHAMGDWERYDRRALHAYAAEQFDAQTMARGYVERYERVLAGEGLNGAAPTLLAAEEKFLPFE